ncbi:hypothetical protein Tco_1069662, partial [Tanacetum coccineum]
KIGIDLPSIFKKKIGDGCSTHFWLDTWLGGSPLKDTFPRLFRLESNPACLVCNRCPTFHPLPHVSSAATSHSAPTPTPPRWSDLQLGLEQAHSVEFGAMFQNCAVLWPISAHLIMVIRGNLRTHGNALWNIPNITITNLLEGLNLADTVPITAASISFFDVVVQTTHWLLWRFRNNTTFATKRPNKQLIIDDVKLSSFTWISSRQKKDFQRLAGGGLGGPRMVMKEIEDVLMEEWRSGVGVDMAYPMCWIWRIGGFLE